MPSPSSCESNTTSLAHFDAVGESGIHPIFSAMAVPHLLVHLAHHHCLDLWQQLCNNQRIDPKGLRHCQSGPHVPAKYCTGGHAKLPTKPTDQVPDLPTLDTEWLV
jgi:hypothetical protein